MGAPVPCVASIDSTIAGSMARANVLSEVCAKSRRAILSIQIANGMVNRRFFGERSEPKR